MTTKRVRVNEKVHGRLKYLKEKGNAKSLNDVIDALIIIGEEQYLKGKITTDDKQIFLGVDGGKLVEIRLSKK